MLESLLHAFELHFCCGQLEVQGLDGLVLKLGHEILLSEHPEPREEKLRTLGIGEFVVEDLATIDQIAHEQPQSLDAAAGERQRQALRLIESTMQGFGEVVGRVAEKRPGDFECLRGTLEGDRDQRVIQEPPVLRLAGWPGDCCAALICSLRDFENLLHVSDDGYWHESRCASDRWMLRCVEVRW